MKDSIKMGYDQILVFSSQKIMFLKEAGTTIELTEKGKSTS
jgi:hypothetical protein